MRDPSDQGRNGGGGKGIERGQGGRKGKKEERKSDLNLHAHSLIFPAISQFKGHHNYDGDKNNACLCVLNK